MGFWSKLFKRDKKEVVAKKAVEAEPAKPAAPAKAAAKPAAKKAPAKKPAAKPAAPAKAAAKPAAKKAPAKKQPQCAALTPAGDQCKNSARDGSKYCGSHKGYRPPAKAAAAKAKDTTPKVSGAKDTKPSARREQVSKDGYKLFRNGNRYFFSKKAQKDVTGEPVYEMPKDRTVVKTPNGLPVLKKK